MNCETREIKMWDDLTEEQKRSGIWVRLEDGIASMTGSANPFANIPVETEMPETAFRKKLRGKAEVD